MERRRALSSGELSGRQAQAGEESGPQAGRSQEVTSHGDNQACRWKSWSGQLMFLIGQSRVSRPIWIPKPCVVDARGLIMTGLLSPALHIRTTWVCNGR